MIIEPIDPVKDASRIVAGLEGDLSAAELQDLVVRTSSREPAVYVAAIDGTRVVGLSCFRPHRLGDGPGGPLAYQAAGVMTSRDYRGKGIFPNVVHQSENILRAGGGAMIFGFPNANAYPIWTKKLGYDEVKLIKWRAPALFGLAGLFVGDGALAAGLAQDDADMIASKRGLYGDDLVSVAIGEASAWAVKRSNRKAGIDIAVLDIGGIRCRDGRECKALIAALVARAGGAVIARLTTTAGNPLLPLLRKARPAAPTHEVVITKWLNPGDADQRPLAFYSGMADWF